MSDRDDLLGFEYTYYGLPHVSVSAEGQSTTGFDYVYYGLPFLGDDAGGGAVSGSGRKFYVEMGLGQAAVTGGGVAKILSLSRNTTTKTSGDIIYATLSFGEVLESDTSVYIVITGGHSQYEDYGTGQHYEVYCSDATIENPAPNQTTVSTVVEAGESSKTIALRIIDNPTWELDRTITIYASGFGSKSFTIVDDHTGHYLINAVTDYALWGGTQGLVAGSESYANHNKSVLADIVSYIRNRPGYDATVNATIVYIPEGEYYFCHGNYLWPGIALVGDGIGKTVIRRPSKSWYVSEGYPVADGGYYYYGMFMYRTNYDYWNAADDSQPGGLRDLSYNGNFDTFWPFSPYTLFEQSTMYVVDCRNHTSLFGRNYCIFENLDLDNEITTYVAVVDNAKIRYCNVIGHDNVPDKGIVSNVGGNWDITAKWMTVDDNQWDIEVNHGDAGHYGDGRCNLEIRNSFIKNATFGGPVANGGTQTLYLEDCTLYAWSLSLPSADVTFKNCITDFQDFDTEPYGTLNRQAIWGATKLLYEGGSITINPAASGEAGVWMWPNPNSSDWDWTFKDVEVIKGPGTFPDVVYGFWEENPRTPGTPITFDNVTFTGDFDACIYNYLGAKYIVKNGITVDGAARVFQVMGYDASSMNLNLSVSGTVNSNAPIWLATPADGAGTGNVIDHDADGFNKSNCKIYVTTMSGTCYLSGWGFSGSRAIEDDDEPPYSGLPGDVYTAANVGYVFDCTALGYERANPSLNVAATFVRQPVTGWNWLTTPIDITSMLTADSTWRTTGTITSLPSNAQSIYLICTQSDTTGRTVGFRRPDVTTDTKFSGTYSYKPFWTVCGVKNRTLDYYASDLTNTTVKILAYSTESNSIESGSLPDYTPSATGSYQDKTFSEMGSTGVWAVCHVQKTTTGYASACRDDGATYDYYLFRPSNVPDIIFVPTTSKTGEIKIAHTSLVHLLTAWLPGGKLSEPVDIDLSGVSINTWTEIDLSSYCPFGAEMAVVEIGNTTANAAVGFRLPGSSLTDRPGIVYNASPAVSQFRLIPLSISRKTVFNRSSTNVTVRLWGWVTNA